MGNEIITPARTQIDYILQNFDFNKVRKTMIALDWNWSFTNARGIPDITTLKLKAEEILQQCFDQKKGSIATGGFYAYNDNGRLGLSFYLTETSFEE